MFKKTLTVLLSLTLLLGIFTIAPRAEAFVDYDYEYIDQSAYPSSLAPNVITNVWIQIKNTGTVNWYNSGDNVVRLGAGSVYGNSNQQRDYHSEFYDSITWSSDNRPVAISDAVVQPGESTHFQFNIKAPSTPGVYKAYFTPVADGITWMKDMGIYWQITVVSEGGSQNEGGESNSGISVSYLEMSPSDGFSVRSGDVSDFVISAHYTDSSVQDVTDMVTWNVTYGTGTGTMHTEIPGRFIAGGIGTCTITASFAGRSVSSGTITITPL